MKGKILVCRCEDVTLKDVEHAIERGYADIEGIKRYTGFGTGPCQGQECLSVIAGVVSARTGREVFPFTARPPLAPAPLRYFAGLDLSADASDSDASDSDASDPDASDSDASDFDAQDRGARK